MTFRKAETKDIGQIIRLRLKLQAHLEDCNYWSLVSDRMDLFKSFYKRQIHNPNVSIFLALNEKGVAIGMIMAAVIRNPFFTMGFYGRIDDMWVDEEYRNKKIASKLVLYSIKFFKRNHVDKVLLEYVKENIIAKDFWHGLGFKPLLVIADNDIDNLEQIVAKKLDKSG